MLGNSEVHVTGTLKKGFKEDTDLILDMGVKGGRNGYDLGPGSPHCHSIGPSPKSPPPLPLNGATECLGDKAGASPALALRRPQVCCSPALLGWSPSRRSRLFCRVLWAHCSSPLRGRAAHDPGLANPASIPRPMPTLHCWAPHTPRRAHVDATRAGVHNSLS